MSPLPNPSEASDSGEAITFLVNGESANASATWEAGSVTELRLWAEDGNRGGIGGSFFLTSEPVAASVDTTAKAAQPGETARATFFEPGFSACHALITILVTALVVRTKT